MKKKRNLFWLVLIIPVLLLAYCLINQNSSVLGVTNFITGFESSTLGYSTKTQLIDPIYSSNESIVADFVIDSKYSTGTISATKVIKNALTKCGEKGGGTVYLPAGKYLIDGQISVPVGCTIRGDYQDPDTVAKKSDLKYGTILMINGNINKDYPGVFQLHSGSGAVGLTIFYTGLTLSNVNTLNNTWTFYYEDNSNSITFKDITFINANRGIGKYSYLKELTNPSEDYHTKLRVDNVKGTFLNTGIAVINSSDVGTMDNVTMSPKYWANANASVLGVSSLPTSDEITTFAQNNSSIGIFLEAVEQSQFNNIRIDGHRYGVYAYERHAHNTNARSRASSSGEFFNLNITGVINAIYADADAIDRRYGFTISNSNLEGNIIINSNAIPLSGNGYYMNGSSWIQGSANGSQLISLIKLYETNIKGTISGNGVVKYSNGNGNYQNATGTVNITKSNVLRSVNGTIETKTTGHSFVAMNVGDTADSINQALKKVGTAGGGVVYLPAGEYIINKPLRVPANVELRGSNAVNSSIFGTPSSNPGSVKGTPIGTIITIKDNITAIVLAGDNAGVTGINFGYENVIANINKGSNIYDPQNAGRACREFICYTGSGKTVDVSSTNNLVSIQAANVNHPYVSNVTIIGAMYGIEFYNCHDFVANNIVTSILSDGIFITNSNLGTVRNMLQNGVILTENYFYPFKSSLVSLDTNLRNVIQITSDRYTALNINGSSDLLLENIFNYAGRNLIYAVKSSFYGINHEVDTHLFEATKGLHIGYNVYGIDNETVGTVSNVMSIGSVFYSIEPSKLSIFNMTYLNLLDYPYESNGVNNVYGGFDLPNKYKQIYLLKLGYDTYSNQHLNKTTNTIENLDVGTNVNGLGKIFNNLNYQGIEVYHNGTKTTGNISTGDEIKINVDGTIRSYKAVVNSDVNGDGYLSVQDVSVLYKKVKSDYADTSYVLSDSQLSAGDLNKDKKVSINDVSILYKKYKNIYASEGQ